MSTTRDYTIMLKVRADLQDALGKIGSFDKSLHGLKSTALEIGGALGIAFGVKDILEFGKSILDSQAKLVDLNQITGISVETLSALRFEAQKNGVQVDDLSAALTRVAVSATKNNPAFAAMGISVTNSNGHLKDTSTILQEVATKFASYKDGPEKAAIATALFGKAGADLIPMLNDLGNVGLAGVTAKAKEAGAVIGKDAADGAKAFEDALSDLKTQLINAATQGVDGMLTPMNDLAKTFKDPEFKQGLADIASAIVRVGKAGAEASVGIASFMKWVGEELASKVVGPFDKTRIDARIGEIDDRIKALQTTLAHPVKSGLSEFLNGLARGPNVNPGVVDDATRSTAAIEKEIAALEKEKKALQERQKQFDDKPASPAPDVKKGDGKGDAPNPNSGDDAKMSEGARAAAAALAKLQDQLSTLRTQGLDPTAAAWAKYNKTVDDAIAEAKKAGNTPEANAAMQGIVEQAARLRDTDLAKIAADDRAAYEQLKQSLETPADVNLDQAIAKLKQLNDLMASPNVKISAQEYAGMVARIGQQSIEGALPDYHSPRELNQGPASDLAKNFADEAQLEEAYRAEKLALNKKFDDADQQQEEAHQAALAALDKKYADERSAIEQARGQLQLTIAAGLFGQLATLSSSHNRKVAEIGKAAAIAQAIITTYQNATVAYGEGLVAGGPYAGPAVGAIFAAIAVAAGLANVAAIRSQSTGGYSEGGYTGPGGKYQPAGIVHKGEGVLDQGDIAALGGPTGFHALRRSIQDGTLALPGYADGGLVAPPFASYSTPDQLGFAAPRRPRADIGGAVASSNARPSIALRIVNMVDQQTTLDHVASAEGEQVLMNIMSRNQTKLRQLVK